MNPTNNNPAPVNPANNPATIGDAAMTNPADIAAALANNPAALAAVAAALANLANNPASAPAPANPAPNPAPAADILADLARHNAAARKSYKVCADGILAELTYDGVDAYYAETLQTWAACFAGTAYEVKSTETVCKQGKSGVVLSVVVKTANHGTVYLTTNSTTSIDYRRLTDSYVKRCDKRAEKSANKSAGSGRRASMSDVKLAARAVDSYARAAVKRLQGDEKLNDKMRTMVTNYISAVCVERDVERADVLAALNDKTLAAIS